MSTGSAMWRVRQEGTAGEGLAVRFDRLAERIEEGGWGESVEVKGPQDRGWKLLEEHEATGDLMPGKTPFGKHAPEEAELDMTPMIDIVFQLLIFFMLVASFAVQKTQDTPDSGDAKNGVTLEDLQKTNIMLTVAADGAITIDGQSVALEDLADALADAVDQRSTAELVLDIHGDVIHEVGVKVLDAAGAARIQKVKYVERVGEGEGESDEEN